MKNQIYILVIFAVAGNSTLVEDMKSSSMSGENYSREKFSLGKNFPGRDQLRRESGGRFQYTNQGPTAYNSPLPPGHYGGQSQGQYENRTPYGPPAGPYGNTHFGERGPPGPYGNQYGYGEPFQSRPSEYQTPHGEYGSTGPNGTPYFSSGAVGPGVSRPQIGSGQGIRFFHGAPTNKRY